MKRIIDGVTFNTDTATRVARAERTDEGGHGWPAEHHEWVLYQTRGGAFFVVDTLETSRKTAGGEWKDVVRHEFEPVTRDRAQTWILEGEVEIFANVFDEPPEASAEDSPAATLYIRVPASLKERLEGHARQDGLSLNSWTTRCVERCASLDRIATKLARILTISANTRSFSGSEEGLKAAIQSMTVDTTAIVQLLDIKASVEAARAMFDTAIMDGRTHDVFGIIPD